MMFSRKYPPKWIERALEMAWPRGGLHRGWFYLWHRLKRLRHHPHSVALGFAIGVFVSFTPFLGFHLAMCVGFSLLFRVSILASFIGQTVGNPVTFPFIYLLTYKLGDALLYPGAGMSEITMEGLMMKLFSLEMIGSIIFPLIAGGFILGPIFAALSYGIIYFLMTRASVIGGGARKA